jgi:hypothetical protein
MSGKDWMKSTGKPMSPFGERVADMLGEIFNGIYHIEKAVRRSDFTGKRFISMTISESGDFATYDSSYLTALVLWAHVKNIRVAVRAATHGYLKLEFMEVDRNGFFRVGHPTLAESLKGLGITDEMLQGGKSE